MRMLAKRFNVTGGHDAVRVFEFETVNDIYSQGLCIDSMLLNIMIMMMIMGGSNGGGNRDELWPMVWVIGDEALVAFHTRPTHSRVHTCYEDEAHSC